MADNILMPSGSGGLMRYNDEYRSKFMFSPNHIVVFIILVIIVMGVLKIFF
jgi:preprotein translocase subunit Sec61beta